MISIAQVLAEMSDVAEDTYEGVAGAKQVARWLEAIRASRTRPEVSARKEPEPHSYALLKLEGAAKPLFFVMEERYGSPTEEDYQGHRRYFYEEHSCPTNWLGNCVAVIEAGDSDPHGYLTFVRSVPIKPDSAKDMNGEEEWAEIFPEAFCAPQKREGSDG